MPKQLPPIDDEIYEYLKSKAIPLEDDLDSLLRRLLGMPAEAAASGDRATVAPSRGVALQRRARSTRKAQRARSTRKAPRAQTGSILSEQEYEVPILRALLELQGRAAASEVIDRVGQLLKGRLTPADHEKLASGDVRWRNRAQFVRLSLIKKGHMKAKSPRGIWELSDQGRRRAEKEL